MTDIHSTAIIEDGAVIGKNVIVGPYATVAKHVILGDDVTIKSHVVVEGHTKIDQGTVIHAFAAIGTAPQDLKYQGEAGRLVIGRNNTIREHVTMNIGTENGGMLTQIGDDNLLMVGVHIGHDCQVGNKVILVNNATLAGHVVVGDHAVLGGLCAVHQFCHIGKMAMIGGMTGVEHDVIPYGTVMGNRASLKGLNLVGLDRSGIEKEKIHQIRAAYKKIFEKSETQKLADRLDEVAESYADNSLVMDIVAFLRRDSKRRFVMPD
ncbi:MAG: acyl-ACP--UDP-N-acetylglucosamine O-acyltransferase [Pseudomonadota bacterium]